MASATAVCAPLQILVREKGQDDVLFQSNLAPHLSLVHLKKAILAISKATKDNAAEEGAKEESAEALRERISILEEENQRLIEIIKDKNKIINELYNKEVEQSETSAIERPNGSSKKAAKASLTPKLAKKRMAKSERNIRQVLTGGRSSIDDKRPQQQSQSQQPIIDDKTHEETKEQSAGAEKAAQSLSESAERLRVRTRSADADKRTERLLLNRNLVARKDLAIPSGTGGTAPQGSDRWTSANAPHCESSSPSPNATGGKATDAPLADKDGQVGPDSEQVDKTKRLEVFANFQRQVSITNMALFAQKERQKMARMVEQERERDQLRRSAERRGQQGHAVPETGHQPPPPTLEAAVAAVGEAAASDTAQDVSESEEDKTKREETTKVAEGQRVGDDAAVVSGEEEEEDVEEKHRARVRNELIETEINYIHNLQILDAVLHAAREAQVARNVTLNIRELSTLLTLHQTFLSELQEANNSFTESFLSFVPFMKIYTAYFNAYSQVSTNVAKLHSSSAFVSLLKECEERLNKESGSSVILDLDSLLILPIQRIPRYELLLSDYLKHSHKKPEELPRIQKLLTSIKELNLFLNQARRQEESVKQLSEIQQALVFPKGKEAPMRRLVHQGELRIKADDGSILTDDLSGETLVEDTAAGSDGDQSPPVSPSSRRSKSQLLRQRSFDVNKHRAKDKLVQLSSTMPSSSSMSSLPSLSSSPSASDAVTAESTNVDGPMAAAAVAAVVKPVKPKRGGSWLDLGSAKDSNATTTSPRLLPLKLAGRNGSKGSSSSSSSSSSASSSSSSSRSYKRRRFFLFDDLLLETEPEKDGKYRFVRVHYLNDCFIASTYSNEADERDAIAWVSVSAGERHLLKTKSPQDKVLWMEALLKCMKPN